MNKTLKQIADELGIDKQKIYRYVKKHGIEAVHQESTSKPHQAKQYDEAAQTLIKQAFCEKEVHQESTSEAHQNHISESVIDALLKQLDEKDKQIKELTKLLDQEQQLRLVAEKKNELLEAPKPKKWQFWK